jgi:Ca2+-binding RTX toxin-like protein
MAGGSGDDVHLLDEFGPDAGAQNIFVGNEGVDQVQLEQTADNYLINRATAAQITELNNLLDNDNSTQAIEFRGFNIPELQLDPALPVLRIDRLTDSGRQTDFVQAEELVFAENTFVFESLDGEAFLTTASPSDTLIHNGGGRPIQETGDNYVLGKNADDRLIGGDGDDDLRGGGGDDVLVSLGGADALSGDSGDDTLIAFGFGTGAPAELSGGQGADTFVIVPQANSSTGVTIKQFSLVEDLINLDGLLNASGDAFMSADLTAAIEAITVDDANNALEIDLSDFFLQDPDDADSMVSANGVLRIEFQDDVNNTDNNPSSSINYTNDNPVAQTDWWNDLLNDGGLI